MENKHKAYYLWLISLSIALASIYILAHGTPSYVSSAWLLVLYAPLLVNVIISAYGYLKQKKFMELPLIIRFALSGSVVASTVIGLFCMWVTSMLSGPTLGQ